MMLFYQEVNAMYVGQMQESTITMEALFAQAVVGFSDDRSKVNSILSLSALPATMRVPLVRNTKFNSKRREAIIPSKYCAKSTPSPGKAVRNVVSLIASTVA